MTAVFTGRTSLSQFNTKLLTHTHRERERKKEEERKKKMEREGNKESV